MAQTPAGVIQQASSIEKSVEVLEREITCPICGDHYKEPKVLPCYHYYCKECIYKLLLRCDRGQPISCPECRQDAVIPNNNVDQLPPAFFINRIQPLYEQLKQKVIVSHCEMCDNPEVSSYCQQCAQHICSKCVEAHQRMKVFSGHKLVKPEESTSPQPLPSAPVGSCKEHRQPTVLYCFDCSSLICRDCTVREHFGHDNDFVDKAASLVRKDLTEEVEQLKTMIADLSQGVDKIKDTVSEMEAQRTSAVAKIDDSFQELYQILDETKQQLKDKASSLFQKKLQSLGSQLKSISDSVSVVQRVAGFTEQCIQHVPDCEIMYLQSDLRAQMRRVKEDEIRQAELLEPSEEMNIDVKLCNMDDFKRCIADAEVSLLYVDPSKCTLSGETIGSFERSEILKPTIFNIVTKLSNGQLTKQESSIDCHLKSLVSGSVSRCGVDESSQRGEYRIQCLPTIRGQNQLTITVNGQEITDSPFHFCAYCPPGDLGVPLRVIKDLNLPHGIAVNSGGEMIVTEWGAGGSVARLTKDGKVLARVRQPNLSHPTGVDMDTNDNVYITDSKSNWIFKFNKRLQLVRKEKHTSVSASLHGVSVMGDEVMVSNKSRHTITVYNTNLNRVRTIEAHAHLTSQYGIVDLSGDSHGNIYVSHYGNRQVQVLNSDGDLVCSFEGKNSPSGLCVAGAYVYVASETEHKVRVYTTEGELVATFGQWGNKPGDFYTPCGVCVRDSFVYVCDRYNNRVQVF